MGFRDWFLERMEAHFRRRYGARDDAAVHVHELLQPVGLLPQLRGERGADAMGFLVVGELVENGLRAVLGAREPPRVRRRVEVDAAEASRTGLAALREAGVRLRLDRERGVYVFEVDGATDLLVPDDPDGVRLWELKTTRAPPGTWRGYMDKWRIQARLYSALYGEPVRLLILHLNERELSASTLIESAPTGFLACVAANWLRGELYPWTGCG